MTDVSTPRDRASGGGIEIHIDREACMGSGNCLYWAPATFDLADDGAATILDPAASDEEKLRVAAEGCPVGAISLWRGDARIDRGEP
jgi:ferredoxin